MEPMTGPMYFLLKSAVAQRLDRLNELVGTACAIRKIIAYAIADGKDKHPDTMMRNVFK